MMAFLRLFRGTSYTIIAILKLSFENLTVFLK